jgi:hypothetical protein
MIHSKVETPANESRGSLAVRPMYTGHASARLMKELAIEKVGSPVGLPNYPGLIGAPPFLAVPARGSDLSSCGRIPNHHLLFCHETPTVFADCLTSIRREISDHLLSVTVAAVANTRNPAPVCRTPQSATTSLLFCFQIRENGRSRQGVYNLRGHADGAGVTSFRLAGLLRPAMGKKEVGPFVGIKLTLLDVFFRHSRRHEAVAVVPEQIHEKCPVPVRADVDIP